MSIRAPHLALTAALLFAAFPATADAPPSPAPQPQAELPQMLDAVWAAAPPMPRGMQDNQVALLDSWLVSVCGFCSGTDNDWKPGVYERGFMNQGWALDLDAPENGWVSLPDFPGAPRQATQGARIADALYMWGGFSYSEPYTYTDGYRLSREDGEWTWQALPPLPSPSCWAGSCAAGTHIYFLGGADYDAERFYNLKDRTGQIALGTRFITIDTADLDAGWKELAPCPGTPRCLTAAAALDGKLYFIGGVAFAENDVYCNVVDSWRYDIANDTWERLRDFPMSGTGTSTGQLLYKDRYILLPCGYQYENYMKPDGSIVPKYGEASKVARNWKQHPKFETASYYNHFYVYDTKTNLYGAAPSLPYDDVASLTIVTGDDAYMFPGETAGFWWQGEYFGHHPEFVMKAKLAERNWER